MALTDYEWEQIEAIHKNPKRAIMWFGQLAEAIRSLRVTGKVTEASFFGSIIEKHVRDYSGILVVRYNCERKKQGVTNDHYLVVVDGKRGYFQQLARDNPWSTNSKHVWTEETPDPFTDVIDATEKRREYMVASKAKKRTS